MNIMNKIYCASVHLTHFPIPVTEMFLANTKEVLFFEISRYLAICERKVIAGEFANDFARCYEGGNKMIFRYIGGDEIIVMEK